MRTWALTAACLSLLTACGRVGSHDGDGDGDDDGSGTSSPEIDAPPDPPLPESPPCGEASETPELSWTYVAGSASQDYVSDLAFDDEGNVYLTGMAGSDVDFGGGALEGSGGFVVSLTADGQYRWGQILEGSAWGSTIDVGPSGEIAVAGVEDSMVYLAALSSRGEHRWDRLFGDGQINTAGGVAIGPDDGVVLAGSFTASADFGGGEREAGGGQDLFVAAYDEGGAYRWDLHVPGGGNEIPIDLAADASGSVHVTGHFSSPVDFGGGVRDAGEFRGAFVLKLDDAGAYQWDWTSGFDGSGIGHAIAVDAIGRVVSTGEFHGSLRFAGTEHPEFTELSGYVLSFEADGTEHWGRTYGGMGSVRPFGIAADASDRVLVAGKFTDEARFGETPRVSAGGEDIFTLLLTGAGESLWDRTYGGPGDDSGRVVGRGCTGTILVGGRDPGDDRGNLVSMDALLVAWD